MQNLTQKFLGRGEPSNSDANVNAGLRNPGVGVSAAEDQAMPQSGTPGLVQQAVYLGNVSGIPLYVHCTSIREYPHADTPFYVSFRESMCPGYL